MLSTEEYKKRIETVRSNLKLDVGLRPLAEAITIFLELVLDIRDSLKPPSTGRHPRSAEPPKVGI